MLAAEKEAGASAGQVKLTVTWSFAMRESVDGKAVNKLFHGREDGLDAKSACLMYGMLPNKPPNASDEAKGKA